MRRRSVFARATLFAALLAACAPGVTQPGTGGDDDDDDDNHPGDIDAGHIVNPGQTGVVTGTVWAPGNGPGQVPKGQEIPISGALVYVTKQAPAPIPQEVYCEQCENLPGDAVLTDADGYFSVGNVRPDTYTLVIQKGQFRLEQNITIFGTETLDLPPSNTTLPSRPDIAHGLWTPRIAIAYGYYDSLQDIFGKMGMGSVDSEGSFQPTSANGVIDFWNNSDEYGFGTGLESVEKGSITDLVGDLNKMKQYHIIFVPCTNTYASFTLFANASYRENIRQYVALGGKFYVTDWAAEWEDAVFPEFIQFASGHDTTASAAAANQFSSGDGTPGYTSYGAKAADEAMNTWLQGQEGPLDEYALDVGPIDANSFEVSGAWDHIQSLPTIQIGVDNDNLAVNETAYAWVVGDWSNDSTMHPLTVSFEPQGCGRVLYSSYHTAETPHEGLLPQERVLLYLIMEIGLCKSGPIVQ